MITRFPELEAELLRKPLEDGLAVAAFRVGYLRLSAALIEGKGVACLSFVSGSNTIAVELADLRALVDEAEKLMEARHPDASCGTRIGQN